MISTGRRLYEVAKAAGVAPITLRRWLLAGKIPEVSRDRNGWRVFSPEEEAAVLKYALRLSPPTKKRREQK